MLRFAIIFLLVALVAAILGFGCIAGASTGIAKIIFYLFVVLFLANVIAHLLRRA